MNKPSNLSLNQSGWLFKTVYHGRFVRRLVFILLLSFLIQPVHRAYANEEVPTPSPEAVSPSSVDPVSVDIPLPPNHTDAEASDVNTEEESAPETVTAPGGEVATLEDSVSEVATTTTVESTASEPVVDDASTADSGDSNTPLTETASATVAAQEEDLVVTDQATTTVDEEVAVVDQDPILPLVSESFSDSEVRFKKEDCVQVDDGSYYCQPGTTGEVQRDAVVSASDADGDLEIFLVKDGEYIQITHNIVDDSAPYYDGKSKSMVWHQLVNDRYQIWEFDFSSGESAALTDGAFNDMEPVRYGSVTVWQRWVDGVWQIMLLRNGELTQLTEGSSHHLTPSVYDDLVLWRTVEGSGVKVLESYDLKTGDHTVIDDPEEAAMVNPRMVMVYEAVYDNGDRVTRGVDIATGKIIALGALPTELPETIPDTDATGETRALIQAKPATKEGSELELTEPVPALDPPQPLDPFTLVIGTTTDTELGSQPTATSLAPVPSSTSPVSDGPVFDLVIPAATSTQPSTE